MINIRNVSEIRQVQILSFSFNIVMVILASATKQEKIKSIKIRKEEIKLPTLADNKII